MGRLGEARLNTTPSVTTHGLSPIVRSARHCRLRRPRWGTAGHGAEPGEELLGATPYGTADRRPNRGSGPRAAAEATRHNVTKPHRLRTYRDAGGERAFGAAGQSMHQAGASTSRLKAPLAVDSGGVAGLKWAVGEARSRIDHADVGLPE